MVLAVGLACSKGMVAIVDLARELPFVRGAASAADAGAEVTVSVDADISQSMARAEEVQNWARSGDLPGGQPDTSDKPADKSTQLVVGPGSVDDQPRQPFVFTLPPELEQ